mgnify:CR=1 FL=1
MSSSIGTKNFSQSELEKSAKAEKNKIDNRIPTEYLGNAQELLNALQVFRDVLGKPIKITSGYRCEKLNRLVGGVSNSSHLKGWAADLSVSGMSAKELFYWMSGFLKGSKMKFGQLIVEHSRTGSWVHFSIRDNAGQRCDIREMNV